MSGAIIAASIRRARLRIERDLEDAMSPESAIAYTPRDRPLSRRTFRRMVDFGAVRETTPGRYYLDRERADAYRTSRRRKAAAFLALGAAAIAALAATS